MPALEPLRGVRIVASEAGIAGGRFRGGDAIVLPFAPDEVFVIDFEGVRVFEDGAIYELEAGFVGAWLSDVELEHVRARTEWPLRADRPVLAQGKVAGVPAKMWLADDGRTMLLTHAAYAHELEERLGWR